MWSGKTQIRKFGGNLENLEAFCCGPNNTNFEIRHTVVYKDWLAPNCPNVMIQRR